MTRLRSCELRRGRPVFALASLGLRLKASDFALQATTGQADPTSRRDKSTWLDEKAMPNQSASGKQSSRNVI